MEDTRFKRIIKVENNFKIINFPLAKNKVNLNIKNKKIGFNPKLFNENSLKMLSKKFGFKCIGYYNDNLVRIN